MRLRRIHVLIFIGIVSVFLALVTACHLQVESATDSPILRALNTDKSLPALPINLAPALSETFVIPPPPIDPTPESGGDSIGETVTAFNAAWWLILTFMTAAPLGAVAIYSGRRKRARRKAHESTVPNALAWKGSLIMVGLARSLVNEIADARSDLGHPVFVFSPGARSSHCWNPLDLVPPWPERKLVLLQMSESLISRSIAGDVFVEVQAQSLLAAILAYVLDSETTRGRRTIGAAASLMNEKEELGSILARILRTESDLNEFIREEFSHLLDCNDTLRRCVEAVLTFVLGIWKNKWVDEVTSRSDFNIVSLRRTPHTIIIAAPAHSHASAYEDTQDVVRVFIQQLVHVLMNAGPGADEPHKVLLLFEAFSPFGNMPEIASCPGLLLSGGIQLGLFTRGHALFSVRDEREEAPCDTLDTSWRHWARSSPQSLFGKPLTR